MQDPVPRQEGNSRVDFVEDESIIYRASLAKISPTSAIDGNRPSSSHHGGRKILILFLAGIDLDHLFPSAPHLSEISLGHKRPP
ncbi:hypothetical protein K443DRAFT_674805, partial [Laccaria amethystina LaAM-08-1]